ncbi:DUF7344 domain-containing protein [Natrarchaeobius oligotrophus]|uniref:DUF7344 domain-containing protein n=1 Tax=Natrarchaeobius chitinivorans TaxID=1679083 RepID=A0A3N6MNB3_NATCH|nr:hypothetical protein [Natrarchaeobius chitinivorans]RQH03135.1 hypothetical protein EA472_00620 [Natrarchaeobius chitinivorans]
MANPFDLDDLLIVLADEHRRELLARLDERETWTVDELARALAAADDETGPVSDHSESSERVEIQLRHQHLPKLHAAGLLEYDRRSDTVVRREPSAELRRVIDVVADLHGSFGDETEED